MGRVIMARADHQPVLEPINRPRIQTGELHRVCGRMVAVVVATEESTTPLTVQFDDPEKPAVVCTPPEGCEAVARPLQLFEGRPAVCWTVDAVRGAQVSALYVVASSSLAERVSQVLYGTKRKGGGAMPQVVEVDMAALSDRTAEMGGLEVYGVPFGMLEVARALAQSELDGYDGVIVVDADNVRITPEHVYDLCRDLDERPDLDVVASWITWQRRCPFLFSRGFLEDIEDRRLAFPQAQGRPVMRLCARDHVFGEEKLAPNPPANAAIAEFLDGCTCTALEAVGLARYARVHPGEALYAPSRQLSLMGPSKPSPLGKEDSLLVDAAARVLGCAGAADGDEAEELAWADSFGKRCRMDFPLLNDRAHAGKLAYLDSAATSQRVDVALQAQLGYDMHENANVYRGVYGLSAQSTFTYNDARKRLEDFIGAERRETVFTANTTAATNLVARAWGEWNICEGDIIVMPLSEHHSTMLPFMMLAERKGARVELVPYGPDGRIDQRAYRKALAKGPKLVCVAQVGNVFGIAEPVKEMTDAAHEAGARVLVDAAQSFAHRRIDVKELGADWVAFSAHKAYGPMGIGALWISPSAFDEMDPVDGGGGTVSHVGEDSYYLRPKSIQYELGTPPVSQAVGWAAAIGYLDDVGVDNVSRHDAVLTRYLVEGLRRIDGVTVIGDHSGPDGWAGLVSFTMAGIAPGALSGFLGKLGVTIRADGHCAQPLHASMGMVGTARVSIGVYTTKDEIDAVLAAVEACRQVCARGFSESCA